MSAGQRIEVSGAFCVLCTCCPRYGQQTENEEPVRTELYEHSCNIQTHTHNNNLDHLTQFRVKHTKLFMLS